MRCRRGTSFNTHDTKVSVDERIHIEHNLPQRCDLSFRGILRHGDEGVLVADLTVHINTRRNCLYSECDIRYACDKLVSEGLVEKIGKDHYRTSLAAEKAWKKVRADIKWIR